MIEGGEEKDEKRDRESRRDGMRKEMTQKREEEHH